MINIVSKEFNPGLSKTFFFIRKALYEKIKSYVPALHGRLLDFGCGSKPYQSLFTNVSEYIGLDYNGEGHSHANEHVDVFYDGKVIPFENEYFDSIFSSEVFEHLFNIDEILPELNRVLKPGGMILVTCPFVWNEHEVPVDFARYTRFALQHLFEKYGFTVLQHDKAGDYLSTVYQLRVQYVSEYLLPSIPVLGKMKFFVTNIRPLIVLLMNIWFSFWHRILPKPKELYLNNILLATKNKRDE
ncbi:MAG: class I SAM-dependent methyltransferase [Chitinophagaceae bacterium]|nr:class I SAM-dependent methyltransferase [Chitinophagaceae bacterium]MCA6451733.1 class I SAM-dependent methyltransferase [Chitinophagaceae bacterium]MCA6454993.1 class I SAM-dependent methyltransferase [Chitinophagaceae bacterium]MCA6459867.1 class I SAM-dependent methyltransferase [Chitinophagaceae bacterium]MCA6465726.1 class I SAM-dependent methyltransferase [Chitinophagaceae bacterium]